MRPLICFVAIISLAIASTCMAGTNNTNVISLKITSADHSYNLIKQPSHDDCPLANNGTYPQAISLKPGVSVQPLKIADKGDLNCEIQYCNNNKCSGGQYFYINIHTYKNLTPENLIRYSDGQNPNGVNIKNTLTPFIAYSNGQELRLGAR